MMEARPCLVGLQRMVGSTIAVLLMARKIGGTPILLCRAPSPRGVSMMVLLHGAHGSGRSRSNSLGMSCIANIGGAADGAFVGKTLRSAAPW